MANEIRETIILVLTGCIFGCLIGVLYRINKLQEALNDLKRVAEK